MEHAAALRDALAEDGDIELRFQGGHSIPVHSLKLKLASSVLKDMITAVLDDQIASAAAKRRKTAEYGGRAAGQDMPQVQVSQKNGIVKGRGYARSARPVRRLCSVHRMCAAVVTSSTHQPNRQESSLPRDGVWVCVEAIHHACMPRPSQVDGAYEDWVEVLRLIYHGGGFRPSETIYCGACLIGTGIVKPCTSATPSA